MANNNIVSPGIYINENDQSFIPDGIIQAGAAIVGPTVKGPVERPTLVTSYNDYVSKFGDLITSGGATYTFFNSTAAYTYFNNGGDTLLVTRVVSGSYNEASASMASGLISTDFDAVLTSISGAVSASVLGVAADIIASSSTHNITASIRFSDEQTVTHISMSSISKVGLIKEQDNPLKIGDKIIFPTASLGMTGPGNANGLPLTIELKEDDFVDSFIVKTFAEGAEQNNNGTVPAAGGGLASGSKENVRIEIQNASTASGKFNILVRRGDDDLNNRIVLEQFNNLSLDPFDNDYIGKVIGTQTTTIGDSGTTAPYLQVEGDYPNNSRYIFVDQVSVKNTPNYTDSEGNVKNASAKLNIPQTDSSSMGGAAGALTADAKFGKDVTDVNIQGTAQSDYTQSFYLLNDPNYSYTSIAAPGLNFGDHSTSLNVLLTNTKERADALAVIDLQNYSDGANITSAVNSAKTINNSYAATYFPWLLCSDPTTGRLKWAPPSTFIPGVYAFNDKVGEPWFAPAGLNRGSLPTVVRTQKGLPKANRDTLYEGKVNPIAVFPRSGVVVFGQKTLQSKASALDRINVRRLLITIKQFLDQQAGNVVFEQNTVATRNNFLAVVNPYLESVQQRQGLYAFKVVMDESINTPAVIDRNELVGQVYLQPTKTAEFIILNFNVQPTGATFPEASGTDGGASGGGY
tara:strand:+ start:23 stop:2089 length:2067 start_codon:yes stop_codon:yes gene_type:complete